MEGQFGWHSLVTLVRASLRFHALLNLFHSQSTVLHNHNHPYHHHHDLISFTSRGFFPSTTKSLTSSRPKIKSRFTTFSHSWRRPSCFSGSLSSHYCCRCWCCCCCFALKTTSLSFRANTTGTLQGSSVHQTNGRYPQKGNRNGKAICSRHQSLQCFNQQLWLWMEIWFWKERTTKHKGSVKCYCRARTQQQVRLSSCSHQHCREAHKDGEQRATFYAKYEWKSKKINFKDRIRNPSVSVCCRCRLYRGKK